MLEPYHINPLLMVLAGYFFLSLTIPCTPRKEKFFDKGVQLFIGLLHESIFSDLANDFNGYDIHSSGKVIFPYENKQEQQ